MATRKRIVKVAISKDRKAIKKKISKPSISSFVSGPTLQFQTNVGRVMNRLPMYPGPQPTAALVSLLLQELENTGHIARSSKISVKKTSTGQKGFDSADKRRVVRRPRKES